MPDEIKKYIGPFSGPQMDQIFSEILNYTSERYAKGTAAGVPVASGTAGYNDNAKYYKDQAATQKAAAQTAANQAGLAATQAQDAADGAASSEANASTAANTATTQATNAANAATRANNAADRAEAIVGGQFVSYGQAQGLTDAQKATARKNIDAGGEGRNLLDNWYFAVGQAINQRGATSGTEFTNSKYRIDRWQTTWGASQTGGTWELTNDGLTLTSTNGGVYFRQKLLNYAFLVGKRITASVMLADGTVYSASVIRSSGTQLFSHGLQGFSMGFEGSNAFRFGPSGTGYSFTVKAIKLELGGVSTLANDAPPDPAEELAKCQWYFERIQASSNVGLGVGVGSGTRLFVPVKIQPKRTASPNLSYSGTVAIGQNAVQANATALALNSFTNNTGFAQFEVTVAVPSPGAYRLILTGNSYIDISSDL